MKKTKNLKGFTLVEEVVSLFILSILILVASGMMIAAMRVYSVNVKTQSAQNKGQYVYDLLDDKLTYASGIQYQTIKETDGETEISPLNPPNETYFKGGEVKKIFEDDEVCQNITVDKDGITNSFNNKKIEFGQYNVDVSLELETQATTAASASADNSMNDEALFNLVSNSEVTDSAGYLTPQGEVSFLGGLEIMNQSAEVRTVATAGVDCTFYTKDSSNGPYNYPMIDISKLRGKIAKFKMFNLNSGDSIQLYNKNNDYGKKSNWYWGNEIDVEKSYIDSINNESYDYLILWCKPDYVSFYDKDENLLDANGNVATGEPTITSTTTTEKTTTITTTTTTGKTKTLKIDNSDVDKKEITLWAGETHTFQLSSTLENVNSLYIEKVENYPIEISGNANKNENGDFVFDGNFALTLTALKPASGQPTDFELKVYDRYYFKDQSSLSITDNKGVPITITVHIKVPTVDTKSITVYKGGDSVKINTNDTPLDKLSVKSVLVGETPSTDISVEKRTNGIYVTGVNITSSSVTLTLTYNFNVVSYDFPINVTVEEKREVPSESSSEAPPSPSSPPASSNEASSENSTNNGTSMSSYRMKLTVTVRDKKGKEMYKRSGSISVINYENSNMKDKRFPTDMSLNNTSDSGFVLKIYYID